MTSTPQPDDTKPIADDELIYRRIPVSQNWYEPTLDPQPLPAAFRPRADDLSGLSVVRGGEYNSTEQAAKGPSKAGYYVAVLRAGDLRNRGIEVVPRPADGICGHAEITSLTFANRDTAEAKRIMETLAEELCVRVEGPYYSAR